MKTALSDSPSHRDFIRKSPVLAIIIAGVIAELVFELYAWLVSPLLFGPELQPAKLVMAVVKVLLNVHLSYGSAFLMHAFIGSFGFALIVYLVKVIRRLAYPVSGVVTGILSWFIAQGILASFIGRPFMMEFGANTQSSFG